MPELRKDPVVGRWVIIATERARRPGNVVDSPEDYPAGTAEDCPFCHNTEKPIHAAAIANHAKPRLNGDVSVIPFKNSFLNLHRQFERRQHGMYDVVNGFGTHEIVIETPQHTANMADLSLEHISLIFETYAVRLRELEKNQHLRYAIVYKNYGLPAGARNIGHARSHIMATSISPLGVKEKLTGAQGYFAAHKRCIYCDLVLKELQFQKRVVHETEHFLAVIPFAARFLFEILILPKRHHCDFSSGIVGYEDDLARMMKTLLMKIKIGLDNRAYNYSIQTAPLNRRSSNGEDWKTIQDDYHWHIEILPRLTRMAGFEKGTGFLHLFHSARRHGRLFQGSESPMSEFRRDPVVGQWVVIHTEDSWPPERYEKTVQYIRQSSASCQFCPGKEHFTPPEVDAIREPDSQSNQEGWKVRVVSNKFPALRIEGQLDRRMMDIFEMSNGIGAHEVLIETTDHTKRLADFTDEEIVNVIRKYQSRLIDLAKDTRFKYVIIFKNYGESAGTSIDHPHSQIIALPMIPKYVLEELEGTERYYQQRKRCVFCDIIEQEQREKERIIAENQEFVAVSPFVPRYPFECWILPKQHNSEFTAISENERYAFGRILREILLRIKICLSDPSFNFYLHVTPVNYEGQKSYHWHMEIVPHLTQISGFEWGSGFYVVRTSPEDAARFLRGVVSEIRQ